MQCRSSHIFFKRLLLYDDLNVLLAKRIVLIDKFVVAFVFVFGCAAAFEVAVVAINADAGIAYINIYTTICSTTVATSSSTSTANNNNNTITDSSNINDNILNNNTITS